MTQQTTNLFIGYWLLTTIIGVYWMIKNPKITEDKEYFNLAEVLAKVFPSMLLAWFFTPLMILWSIKLKR